jgi:hypothetical protein
MNKDTLTKLLADYPSEEVDKFALYCQSMAIAKDKKTNELKNKWFGYLTEEKLANLFKRVKAEGLVIDGEHITIGSNGLSYDYIAYKNKMYLAYPESIIDVALVKEGDEFNFSKDSGDVHYSHKIGSPFENKPVIGAYCVIKNKRGSFITLLSRADIDKHRKVAKTDYIWSQWFDEMSLKTIIKKACKQHFADVYQAIEESDNENYNLENPIDLDLKLKQEIEAITTLQGLKEYYLKNKGKGKDFDRYLTLRKEQIQNENS